MKNAFVVALLSALSPVAFAAPFLVCDPYPTNDPAKAVPTEFVVTVSGVAAPITIPAVPAGANAVAMKLDLGPLKLVGSKSITAKARNAWGESAATPVFTFVAGAPAVPGGIGLSAD